jgi:integrase/recombinase XerC
MLRMQELAPMSLTPQDARKFLKEVEVRGVLRDMAIMELMIGGGLRVSEVVHLKVSDIELSERKGAVLIRNAKGGKTRRVPLRQSLRSLLTHYLDEYKPTNNLFTGQRGVLTTHAVTKLVAKYGKKADITLSPHTLRHTFAFAFLAENPSEIVALSQILGHSNINTTAIYTQNRLENLQEKIEKMVV